MTARRALARGALVGALAGAAPAYGYVRARGEETGAALAWRRPHVALVVAAADHEARPAAPDLLAAARRAAAAWSAPAISCTGVRLTIAPRAVAARAVARDGVNRIVLRQDVWARDGARDPLSRYDPDMLAVTTLWTRRAGPGAGEILEADIELNAVHARWDGADGPDLEATLAHEMGHLLGLAHACDEGGGGHLRDHAGLRPPRCAQADAAREEIAAALMYPQSSGVRGPRGPGPDERRAACEIYPARAGGCSLGPPGGPAPGVGLAAAALLWWLRRAAARRADVPLRRAPLRSRGAGRPGHRRHRRHRPGHGAGAGARGRGDRRRRARRRQERGGRRGAARGRRPCRGVRGRRHRRALGP